MNKIILHIPHSSLKLPKKFWMFVCASKEIVDKFVYDICDIKTDKLFGKNLCKKIKAKYSRVYSDVEKYADDKEEVMSRFGMGAIYTKTNLNVEFIKPSLEYKESVLTNYYYPYNKRLFNAVNKELRKDNKLILIDCHSFGRDIIMFEEKKENLPDICIGFNKVYNKKLIDFVFNFFKEKGYRVSYNYPYSGTMVPSGIDEKPLQNFSSVMIEINKEIYINNKQNFIKIQNHLNKLFKRLRSEKF